MMSTMSTMLCTSLEGKISRSFRRTQGLPSLTTYGTNCRIMLSLNNTGLGCKLSVPNGKFQESEESTRIISRHHGICSSSSNPTHQIDTPSLPDQYIQVLRETSMCSCRYPPRLPLLSVRGYYEAGVRSDRISEQGPACVSARRLD